MHKHTHILLTSTKKRHPKLKNFFIF